MHEPLPVLPRPPTVPPVHCGHVVAGARCRAPGLWYLPDVARCFHHLPTEWLPVARARLELLGVLIEESWAYVLDTIPAKETA